MQTKNLLIPNYLFEVSWEVCNKVGGIHTVMATKIPSIAKEGKTNHIVIGPDLGQGNEPTSEFKEDLTLLREWKDIATSKGLRIRIGRWNVNKSPIAILIDFSAFFKQKDAIFGELWGEYQLDSLTGEWDYIEPAIFGYVAGKVIENFVQYNCTPKDKIIGQFHEWMTGTGLLYLKSNTPQVGCVFTTHATTLGRSIAGNNLPLYDHLTSYNANDMAAQFNIKSKQSLEKASALNADAFTTVSEITARECRQFHGRPVDLVTPNGFQDFIKNERNFAEKQKEGRRKLQEVAEGILAQPISKDALFVGTSGRYEFKNKGIDVFIEALGQLNKDDSLKKEIVAFILVPAGHHGPISHLQSNIENKTNALPLANPYLSHTLADEYHDPSLNAIRRNELYNRKEDKVKIFFIPSYLNGDDGIFNVPYYDILAGLDLSVFPSYYEPWGYTPLESVAYKVPTVTTTLAGFGLWVRSNYKGLTKGITVIDRNDHNHEEVVDAIAQSIFTHASYTHSEQAIAKENAYEVSNIALWDNLIVYYGEAYSLALNKVIDRLEESDFIPKTKIVSEMHETILPKWHNISVRRNVPGRFLGLEEIAHNLWWCWNQEAIDLFKYIDSEAWETNKEKNPIDFLDKISLARFEELEKNPKFVENVNTVYTKFKEYMAEKEQQKGPQIAYFCMEYGLHTSLKIYSGGLGVLAGDYLKEASDKGVNMTGVGFLYRYGYFTQRLSTSGNQENIYEAQTFSKIPVQPVFDKGGNRLHIPIDFPGRTVLARVWKVAVGRVDLYLFDTDVEENLPEDKSISHHLYGGDWENRLKQEVILGIGGIKLLESIELDADVYHCNEGHAALIGFERIRQLINKKGLKFDEALEVVRSSSLFTTHTPVPAGHDAFDENMLSNYLRNYSNYFNIDWSRIVGLGRVNPWDSREKFSMSNLAIRMSQETNGVSWLHGKVSQEMFQNLFPGYLADEVPIGFVTNGVHQPTWTAPEWKDLFLRINGGDMSTLKYDRKAFSNLQNVEDKEIWSIRSVLRQRLIDEIKERISSSLMYYSPREIVEITEQLDAKKLTIGFARRFATYKRASLLFRNIDTLNKIVNHPDQPVQFIFAGKAHPADKAGQDLIKRIVEVSKYPQFLGKIIFIENYDMELASKMISGVDIWLNTPTRPMEASGTSGCKAVMNGAMHFSVLDGWWVEGYKKGAGWMLPIEQVYENDEFQNELDAEIVYNTIENEIAPSFYNRDKSHIPSGWVQIIKNSIEKVASEFTMNRMMVDYENRFYNKLVERHNAIKLNNYAMAKDLVVWKDKVVKEWNKIEIITMLSFDLEVQQVTIGKTYELEATIRCGALSADDIGMELVLMQRGKVGVIKVEKLLRAIPFTNVSQDKEIAKYQLKYTPSIPGNYETGIRVFPKNKNLAHQTELCLVKWL